MGSLSCPECWGTLLTLQPPANPRIFRIAETHFEGTPFPSGSVSKVVEKRTTTVSSPEAVKLKEQQNRLRVLRASGLGKSHPEVKMTQITIRALEDGMKHGNPDHPLQEELRKTQNTIIRMREIYAEQHPRMLQELQDLKSIENRIAQARLEQKAKESGIPLPLLNAMQHPENWAGIGVGLGMNDQGYPQVHSIIEGGPAAVNTRLRINDQILRIRGENVEEWVELQHLKIKTVIKAMRGVPETEILLVIARPDQKPFQLKLKLQRQPLKLLDESIDPELTPKTTRNPILDTPNNSRLFSDDQLERDEKVRARVNAYDEASKRQSEVASHPKPDEVTIQVSFADENWSSASIENRHTRAELKAHLSSLGRPPPLSPREGPAQR